MSCPNHGPPRSGCPVANLLDLVGDRWSLLVMRDALFFGRHEFKEFLRAEEGIASNILSSRLKRLCEIGLLASAPHPTNKVKRLYYATSAGKDLLPILLEMVVWSDKHAAGTKVPPDNLAMIKADRGEFERVVRRELESWETANLSD